MTNTYDADDAGTQWHLDRGGSDPVTEHWSSLRDNSALPEGLAERDARRDDVEHGTRAAYDEVRNRDGDREDWDKGREHRDWIRERWPNTKLGAYVTDKLGWHSAFQTNPLAAEEAWTRMWLRQPPFHHKPTTKTKAEPPFADLTRDAQDEWHLQQTVRDAMAGSDRNLADEADFTNTAQLRQLVKEKTGLGLNAFLEKCRDIDTASLENPSAVAYRFGVFSGAPVDQNHAAEMMQTAQHTQATQAAGTWLSSLEQQGRLPADYRDLEPEVANALEALNQTGQRTGDLEADLDLAIRIARNVVTERQQMTGTVDPQVQQEVLAVFNTLQRTMPTGSDSADMARARELVANAYQHQRDTANANRARFASRSVSGAPSSPDAGPAMRRDPGLSYEDDLMQDVASAVRSAY